MNRACARARITKMWSKQGLTFFHRKIGSRFNFDLALEADGWIVRSDVIWYKKNPVPESVRDRCTQAREHIFMLVKSPDYRSDFEAIAGKQKLGQGPPFWHWPPNL